MGNAIHPRQGAAPRMWGQGVKDTGGLRPVGHQSGWRQSKMIDCLYQSDDACWGGGVRRGLLIGVVR